MHFAVTRPMVPPTRTIRAGSDVSNGLCLFHYLCLRRAPTGTRQRQRNEVFLWGSRVFFDRLIRRGPTRKRSKSKTKACSCQIGFSRKGWRGSARNGSLKRRRSVGVAQHPFYEVVMQLFTISLHRTEPMQSVDVRILYQGSLRVNHCSAGT